MPEGDTLFRTAATLRAYLVGRTVSRAVPGDWTTRHPIPESSLPVLHGLEGGRVESIESRGKHLLIWCQGDRAIHSHLGMTGSWHLYREGDRWRKPTSRAALTLEADDLRVVLFTPKVLEFLTRDEVRRHRWLRNLGPDLLNDPVDEAEILRRFRVHDPGPIGEAILNQTIASGVGNVYKSESLFLERIDPWTPVKELPDETVRGLMRRARKLMARNLSGYPRQTRSRSSGGGRLWVYGRQGEPCYECGARIAMRRQGDLGRSTYFCPRCQSRPQPSEARNEPHP